MSTTLIKNISIVNNMKTWVVDVLIKGERIQQVSTKIDSYPYRIDEEIDGEGKYLLPGVIDDQVHFREPGYTHKANIYTESRAAVAGGVTSFMEMPNTNPQTTSIENLKNKWEIASKHSVANYSFYLGTNDNNLEEIKKANALKQDICGIKVFMGSSTGNMLVDNPIVLENIFQHSELLIATHCEKEAIIQENLNTIRQTRQQLTAQDHPIIRDAISCYESSLMAIQIAKKCKSRLHILHISTKNEVPLFTNLIPLKDKNITAEVCVHHLHFTANDYASLGNKIKCNPSIKPPDNREALWEALLNDSIDVIATDHAPHTLAEKTLDYTNAPAGLPLIQHPLNIMLHYVNQQKISIEKVVQKMSHHVADLFRIEHRGYIKEGYFADLVLVDLNKQTKVSKKHLLYKCQWSPFEDFVFNNKIESTWVNGVKTSHEGKMINDSTGKRLTFKEN